MTRRTEEISNMPIMFHVSKSVSALGPAFVGKDYTHSDPQSQSRMRETKRYKDINNRGEKELEEKKKLSPSTN